MDKLSFIKIAPAIALTMCSMVFTSCSDDDENGGGSTPDGPTTTFSDKLLTQVGEYKFHYDEKKRCDIVYYVDSYDNETYTEAEINYENNSIYFDSEGTNMKVSFNKDGYITKISGSWDESEGDDIYTGKLSMSFVYDNSGHLTSMSLSSEEKEIYEGEEYRYSGTGNATYTWDNSNLVTITTKYNDIEDGEEYESIDKYEITYNEEMENKTRQMPYILTSPLFDYDASVLASVGMFGVGPKNLPETIANEFTEDGLSSPYYYEENVSYELNSDGTIKCEYMDYETIDYTYTAISDFNSKAVSRSFITPKTSRASKNGHRLYNMLKHLQKRNIDTRK